MGSPARPRTFAWTLIVVISISASLALAGAEPRGDFGHAARATYDTLDRPIAALGAVGINPLFALGLFGLLGALGAPSLPRLEILSHPAVFASFLALGLLITFGKSTKLGKPIAQTLGAFGELPIALIAAALFMFPDSHSLAAASAAVTHAGMGFDEILFWAVCVSALGSLVIVILALDILIWLSPFPFVDGIFEGVKLVATSVLVALAVFFPTLAMVLSLVILVVAALVVRWAVRAARFGLTVAWDGFIGRWSAPAPMPADEAIDLGPLSAFALRVPGTKKRQAGTLELEAGSWFFRPERFLGRSEPIRLGEANRSDVFQGWILAEVCVGDARVALTGRYLHLAEELARKSGARHTKRSGVKELLQKLEPTRPESAL
ncbi:MAG: hypothetical protein HY791_05390 [Deltaproteobacteria bacterium]|nr:hypothetical protein [Deltaproteobacteria bacterium]